jgi:hypothetical protein
MGPKDCAFFLAPLKNSSHAVAPPAWRTGKIRPPMRRAAATAAFYSAKSRKDRGLAGLTPYDAAVMSLLICFQSDFVFTNGVSKMTNISERLNLLK